MNVRKGKLNFIYGNVNSRKSRRLVEDYKNFIKVGKKAIILKPKSNGHGGNYIVDRHGLNWKPDMILEENDRFYRILMSNEDLQALFIDDVHLLTKDQLQQVCDLADAFPIEIYVYGLVEDFRKNYLESAIKIIKNSDSFIQLHSQCECGKEAQRNIAIINGDYIYKIERPWQDEKEEDIIRYDSLCSSCYREKLLEHRKKSNEIKKYRMRA